MRGCTTRWGGLYLLLIGWSGAWAATTPPADPVEYGYEIAAKEDRSDRGFQSSVVDITMVLRNQAGAAFEREMRLSTLEVPDEQVGDKSVVEFLSPPDVDGTALLSHAKIKEADDQWLYIPALKRVKRIASSNRSGPFVGSEFAYEDITADELNKYHYRYLRQAPCDERNCLVIQRTPVYDDSGYAYQEVWIDDQDYQQRRVEYFDRASQHAKTLVLDHYQLFDGRFWRPMRLHMVNHKSGKETDLLMRNYQFMISLTDGEMSPAALKRLR